MVNYDAIFDALAVSHRRQLLVTLLSSSQRVPKLSGISQEIATADENLLREHFTSSRTIADVDEYAVSMHHIHLPKLPEYGFIEWDRDADLVVQGPCFDEIRPHLKRLAEQQDGHHFSMTFDDSQSALSSHMYLPYSIEDSEIGQYG